MRGQRRNHRAKVLLYSHDTFGLGHLRRCMVIARSLVERHKKLSVLILTGSPIIGAFDFRTRVDFVRIPGVIKLRNGSYTPLSLHMNIESTIDLRRAIIEQTADVFNPDLFIADKEPLGLRGEIEPALRRLVARGAHLVLGLRDVLDEPRELRREWRRKGSKEAIERFYDEVWVYGLEALYRPLDGLRLPRSVLDKVVYTGYLRRSLPANTVDNNWPDMINGDFLLVMTGGGGDGDDLIDWVLTTYEQRDDLPLPALLVLGPFMASDKRSDFRQRADRLDNVKVLVFDAHVEHLIKRARAIVSMGGYNTFCEILSYDKPALIVPREVPRMEQPLRASRAQDAGLVRMLLHERNANDEARDAAVLAEALKALMDQPAPSTTSIPGLLDGLARVNTLAAPWLRGARLDKEHSEPATTGEPSRAAAQHVR